MSGFLFPVARRPSAPSAVGGVVGEPIPEGLSTGDGAPGGEDAKTRPRGPQEAAGPDALGLFWLWF